MDRNLAKESPVTTIEDKVRIEEWNVTGIDRDLRPLELDVMGWGRNSFEWSNYILGNDDWLTIDLRIYYALLTIELVYYPILAIVAVPVNIITIIILSRGKCGLSRSVTRYLVAMAAADLLGVFLDLIFRQIPIVYREQFTFLMAIPVCNTHAVLLYAATDCSVWFTVTFTFDRFVAISCQKLKAKYCTERTGAVVLGTVTVVSCSKNIIWYFMLTGDYILLNNPWFCWERHGVRFSSEWAVIELLHYLFTPLVPFVLILLLNALTIRHILVASRARRRLRGPCNGETTRDPEMENRRKSLILLLVISGNFIALWTFFTVNFVWARLWFFLSLPLSMLPPWSVQELGFMLQLLSCCTNTALYAVTQTKFREQVKDMVKSPFSTIMKCTPRRQDTPNAFTTETDFRSSKPPDFRPPGRGSLDRRDAGGLIAATRDIRPPDGCLKSFFEVDVTVETQYRKWNDGGVVALDMNAVLPSPCYPFSVMLLDNKELT
ncbi:putative G-protein coupled receptor 139 [Rhinoraja longicauda]